MTADSGAARTPTDEQEIRRTVRQVRRQWYRAGVPPKMRRRRAEELQAHLEEAADEGRSVSDVVGFDVAAFAAEWAYADRRRPLLGVTLQFLAAVLVVVGLVSLFGPFGFGHDRVGFDTATASFVVLILAGIYAIHLARAFRARLSAPMMALLAVAWAAGMPAGAVLLQPLRDADAFVAVSPAVAVLLLITGTAVQAFEAWLRRSSRL